MGRPRVDLSGKRFGAYTLLRRVADAKHGNARYLARCDCGRERVVHASALRSGQTKRCANCRDQRLRAAAAAAPAALPLPAHQLTPRQAAAWLCRLIADALERDDVTASSGVPDHGRNC
jgi:hypothetical protein